MEKWRSAFVVVLTLTAFLLVSLGVGSAQALEPPRPGEVARLQASGTFEDALARAKAIGNHRVGEGLVHSASDWIQRELFDILAPPAPPSSWRGMPTRGTVKVFALLIRFSDYAPSVSAATYRSILFGDGQAGSPYDSLRNYYARSSYGRLDIRGDVLGWYNTGRPRPVADQSEHDVREGLIAQALDYYDARGHDFSQYDNDGDGYIDYFLVAWAGPRGEWASFWWGYQTEFLRSDYTLDGKRLSKYSWQWAARDPVVVIHETGHALGLPDYYDYDKAIGPPGGLGGLDMMDGGWGDHNAFSKFLLGWVSPRVRSAGAGAVTLAPSAESPDALIVMPGASAGDPFQEYFLVQNRARRGNDARIPNDGLLIWHVDARLDSSGTDFAYDNSYTLHKLLRLMEADGREEIERGLPADAEDFYLAGTSFGPTTLPGSSRYDGFATGVGVTRISSSAGGLSFVASSSSKTDIIPPVTTVAGVDELWHATPVVLTLTAVDAGGSGLAHSEHSVDGGDTWTQGPVITVPAPPDHSGDGVITVLYRSADKAGNIETAKSCRVKIDTTPPQLSDDAFGGWSRLPVVVSLVAGDTGSGVATVKHRVDDSPWTSGATVIVSAAGAHTIDYQARDNAGNSSARKTCSVRIDTEAPISTASGLDGGWHKPGWVVRFSAVDPESGLASIAYSLDGAPAVTGVSLVLTGNGSHSIAYRSLDVAGNYEALKTGKVQIDGTLPITKALSNVSVRRGERATLTFRIDDLTPRATVVVKIYQGGQLKKTLGVGARATNTDLTYRFRCALPRGRYIWKIYATDMAGNEQQLPVGYKTLVVR